MKKNKFFNDEFDQIVPEPKGKKIQNRKKTKKNKIVKDRTTLVLFVIFILLCILNVFLTYKVIKVKNENNNVKRSAITVPVLGPNATYSISIDVSKMQKDSTKSYTFKVSNIKDNSINTEEVPYTIELVGTDNFDIEVLKNGGANLFSSADPVIQGTLKKNEEQKDTYVVKIKSNKQTKADQLITIKINS